MSKRNRFPIFLILLLNVILGCAALSTANERNLAGGKAKKYPSCLEVPEKQSRRSEELRKIYSEDQFDRKPPIDWDIVTKKDEQRAKRVAEIFAEGCFKTADDYAVAAIIFQHGTVPDHYYQAYLWAKKAFDLGRQDQSQMIANAVDRYLIESGQKQLFAAQSFRNGPNGCHCLGETETSFPDELRIKYTGKSLQDRIRDLQGRNQSKPSCSEVMYCPTNLNPPDRGIFPGIW